MDNSDYLDLLKRTIGLAEALLDAAALAGAIGGILVTKGICTQEEIEEVKRTVYEGESMQRAMQNLAERKAEIEELEKADPYKMFMDLIASKKGE